MCIDIKGALYRYSKSIVLVFWYRSRGDRRDGRKLNENNCFHVCSLFVAVSTFDERKRLLFDFVAPLLTCNSLICPQIIFRLSKDPRATLSVNQAMPATTRGKNRPTGSAQRRLDFDNQDTRTSNEIIDIDDDIPQTANSSRSLASPQKRSPVTSFESPAPSKKPKAVVVTPEAEKEDLLSKYVPTYIHKNVEYCREGTASLPSKTIQIFQWICDRYEVPADFEQQRSFGPLSGTSYEQRVIAEYKLGKLDRKEDAPDNETLICSGCAQTGHIRDDCPSLI